MRRGSHRPLHLLLTLLTLLSLALLATDSFARKTAEILSLKHMDGEVGSSQNQTSLITNGDIVALKIDADRVIIGDRMFIYEPIGSSTKKIKKKTKLLQIGSLVIYSIIEDRVYAKIESITREVHAGDRVRFELPRYIEHGRYFKFIKKIIDAKLEQPMKGKLKIGIIDVTNKHGNVTRLTKAIYKGVDLHFCKRRQFECVASNELTVYLKTYGITTSATVGEFIRKKLAKKFSMDMLITATAGHDESNATVTLTAWDLKENMKTDPYIIKEPVANFTKSKLPPHEILRYKSKTRYGHLKVTVSYNSAVKGKRVDHLFMESISKHLFKKYRGVFSEDISNDVKLEGLTVSIGNRFYKPNKNNIIFDDVIKAGKQRILISATPVLKGGSNLTIGRPIEKLILLNIEPNDEINTEIILTTYVDKAIIIVDSNSTQ